MSPKTMHCLLQVSQLNAYPPTLFYLYPHPREIGSAPMKQKKVLVSLGKHFTGQGFHKLKKMGSSLRLTLAHNLEDNLYLCVMRISGTSIGILVDTGEGRRTEDSM